MPRLTLLTALIVLALPACAPATISPPAEPTHPRSHTFDASYEEVWDRAVDWFSESNIPIRQIERASGLIASEHQLGADEDLIDCGDIDPGDNILQRSERTANMNVRVREADDGVLVQIDVFGRGSFTFHDPMINATNTLEAPRCVSTGEVERWLVDYIEDALGGDAAG